MTPEQHRVAAAELILDGGRDGHRPSVLKHLELSGVEHTAEDAKAIFELIHNATITMEFPEHVFTSTPYVSTLLAEIDKLNDDLRLMRETVTTLVDQRDAARVEIEHLRAQLGQAVDVLMANGWKQEADRLDLAQGGIVRSDVTADNPGFLGSGCTLSDVARVIDGGKS